MFHCHGILTRVCRYIIIYYHVLVHHFYIFFLECEFKPSHHPSNPRGIETFRRFGCAIRTSRSRIARCAVMRDGDKPRRRTLEDCESAMGLRREKTKGYMPWFQRGYICTCHGFKCFLFSPHFLGKWSNLDYTWYVSIGLVQPQTRKGGPCTVTS